MSSTTLPPIALEAVLKLLAVGQSGLRRDDAAAKAEKPALRLDGAAQTPLPAWPGLTGRIDLPRGVPGRPARRAPGRSGNQSPRRDPRPFLGEE